MRVLALVLLTTPSAAQDPAILEGRLLDAAGAPVAHARIELSAAPADPELAATWVPPALATDAEGFVRARFAPPGVPLACRVMLPSGDTLTHTWHDVGAGDTIDLGEVRLPAATTISGRIATPLGDVLTDGWLVYLDLESRLAGGARLRAVRRARPSPESGEFRFEGVPALPLKLTAYHALGQRVSSTLTEVSAGGETFVELLHTGVDPRRVLEVRLVHWARKVLEEDSVVLVAADGTEVRPRVSEAANTVRFEDLVEPEYRLEVRDPAFQPATRAVRPGRAIEVAVRGTAWVTLRVVDGADGPPIERFGVRVRVKDRYPSAPFTLRNDGVSGVMPPLNLVPVPCLLEVRPDRRPPVFVRLDDLAPGETRTVEVVVPRSVSVRGRVFDAGGDPVRGARVRWSGGEVTTDGIGAYALEADVWPLALTAALGPLVRTSGTAHLGVDPRLDLTLPPWTRLSGRALLPEGIASEDLRLEARVGDLRALVPLASDGTFVLEAVPLRSLHLGGREVRPRRGGAQVELDLRRRALTRTVKLLDRDGRARPRTLVRWSQSAGGLEVAGRAVTDDRGQLDLTLFSGVVDFRGADEGAEPTPLTWSDALPRAVEVTLREDNP